MREYDSGAVSTAEMYFSNEQNESATGATRSEQEFVITHSHSLFAVVAPLAASEFKKLYKTVTMLFKQGRSNGRIALTHHGNRM
jgi:hypothetical protein